MITKEKFLEVYNQNPPSKFVLFMYRYFSKSTERENLKLSNTITEILAVSFMLGFIGTIVKLPRRIIFIATIIYGVVLVVVVFSILLAHLLNRARLKRIQRYLGISRREYQRLSYLYLK